MMKCMQHCDGKIQREETMRGEFGIHGMIKSMTIIFSDSFWVMLFECITNFCVLT